jgi:hypothetical protein
MKTSGGNNKNKRGKTPINEMPPMETTFWRNT